MIYGKYSRWSSRGCAVVILLTMLSACGGGTADDNGGSLSNAQADSVSTASLTLSRDDGIAYAETITASATVACSAPDWVAGKYYLAAAKVRYVPNGKIYEAKHANPGYNPTISTWYWSESTCGQSLSPSPVPPPATASGCVAPDWISGKFYATGAIVRYPANGRYYKAVNQNPGYDPTISTWYWTAATCTQAPAPVGTVKYMITEAQFNQMFPSRNTFYTYASFVTAAKMYPDLFRGTTDVIRKRELAAFFANVKHETGSLIYIREINQANWSNYCQPSTLYPCSPGEQYYGRGPIQLSWNYNYALAGKAIGVDLLRNPDFVARDPVIAWKTAVWFWMTQSGAGTMTPHHAMLNSLGFAETIRSINGALECKKPAGSTGNQQMNTRVQYYREFTTLLGVTPGANLTC